MDCVVGGAERKGVDEEGALRCHEVEVMTSRGEERVQTNVKARFEEGVRMRRSLNGVRESRHGW
jgi:hypothetical protein